MKYEEWKASKEAGLSISLFPKELQPMFSVVDNYHCVNENTNLSLTDLSNLLFAQVSKDHPYYQGVLEQLSSLEVSDDTTKTLVKSLVRNEKLKEISLAAYEVTEGRKSEEDLNELLANFNTAPEVEESEEDDFVSDDLEFLVNRAVQARGLRWRLNTLNRMLGSLRKGDFGFLFARPETGKTTFLASEVAHMALQLEEGQLIIWFNNEEEGGKVMLRIQQSVLGVPLAQILSNPKHFKAQYDNIMKGRLRLVDDGGLTKTRVKKLLEKYKPAAIVVDQIDKVQGFEADREDLKLGSIYQWFREQAKLYGPVIGVSQADGQGEGVKWLTMAHVANAKTAKQAEADWILGIGKSNDAGYETLRYLHASKNKLMGDEDTDHTLRHGKVEVLIEPHIARYKDLM